MSTAHSNTTIAMAPTSEVNTKIANEYFGFGAGKIHRNV
jgi:hypothetical protein